MYDSRVVGGATETRRVACFLLLEFRRDRIEQPLLRIPRVPDIAGDRMMPVPGVSDRVRVASAALGGVPRVTHLAQRDASLERPIAQQARHDKGERAEAGPPGGPPVARAGARLVRAATGRLADSSAAAAAAAAAVPVHAMIKQSFHAAQARSVIENSLGGAEALVVAQPLAGQRGRLPARLATTSTAEIAHYRQTGRIVSPGGEAVGRLLGKRDRLFGHGVRRRGVRRDRAGGRGRVRPAGY